MVSDNPPSGLFGPLISRARSRIAAKIGSAGAFVAEYPKSGGTWLSLMLAELLDVPTSHVQHHHRWPDGRRLPSTYLVRNPRSVAVSFYKHHLRALHEEPHVRRRLRHFSDEVFSSPEFPTRVEEGLPRFLDALGTYPLGGMVRPRDQVNYPTWAQSVSVWGQMPAQDVLVIRYEDLRVRTVPELIRAASFLGKDQLETNRVQLVADAYSLTNRRNRTRAGDSTNTFIGAGSIDAWPDPWSDDAELALAAFTGGTHERFGY